MLKVLIITHVASEGPGTIGQYLKGIGADVVAVNLQNGGRLPASVSGVQAIVTMGGPMNVDETHRFPYLDDEKRLLRDAVACGVPVLGVCLGAQLLARACGSSVYKASAPEIGWYDVALTRRGRADPLLAGVDGKLRVLQWHEDTFDVPDGGTLLVEGMDCRNQAFRVGNAYGLQFHVEVTREMLIDWFGSFPERTDLIAEFCTVEPKLHVQAKQIFRNFVRLALAG